MVRGLTVFVVLAGVAATARAQPDPCAGVACSDHGECMLEGREPFCFCHEGFAADGLRCEAAIDSGPDARATRSASVGARIVMIASAEGGRRIHTVGQDLAAYPGPLAQYVKPGGLWCTDFVAWVYRAAGLPFTSGYEGGWHLTNNFAVRRWFERSGRWVSNGSPAWGHFEPRPGDYLRFDTDRYGHSAIVRYVAGDALYTVEGNARGEVRLRRYPRYKENRRIDGFGIVTEPTVRAAWLAALSASVDPSPTAMDLRRGASPSRTPPSLRRFAPVDSAQDQSTGRRLDEQARERRGERARP